NVQATGPGFTILGDPSINWQDVKDQVILYDSLSFAKDATPHVQLTHKTNKFEGRLDYVFTYPAFNGQDLMFVGEHSLPSGDVEPMPNEQSSSDHYAVFNIFKY